MTPNEDASRADHADTQPVKWIYGIGFALFVAGALAADFSPGGYAADGAAWTAAMLLMALSLFVLFAVPGALLLLRHPWGAAVRRGLEQRLPQTNPRSVAVMMLFLGIWVPGLLVDGWLTGVPALRVIALLWLPLGPPVLVIALARKGRA